MHKFPHILFILLLSLILAGCGQSAPAVPETTATPETTTVPIEAPAIPTETTAVTETTVPAESTEPIPETLAFEFPLPDGYTLSPKSNTAVSIVRDGQTVGGIIRTDLDVSCTGEPSCPHIDAYLDSFAPAPLIAEYCLMWFDGKGHVSLQITDYETGPINLQSHMLFPQDSIFYDIWVDRDLVSATEQDVLEASVLKK